MQPYENFTKEQAIRQGSSVCGPTAFCLMMSYYNDLKVYTDKYGDIIDLNESIDEIKQKYNGRFSSKTKLGIYLDKSGGAIGWNQLRDGADNLYLNNKKYYTVENNFHSYSNDLDVRSSILRNKIYSLLEYGYPVMIYMDRMWPIWGHYMVIMGYNKSDDIIYVLDPNRYDNDDLFYKVSFNDFINTKWYIGHYNKTAWWMKATWNGQWLSFHKE